MALSVRGYKGQRVVHSQGRPKQTTSELIRENERLRVQLETIKGSRLASNATVVLREAIKWGLIGYFGWQSVAALAGKTTLLDAAIDVDSTTVSQVLSELVPSWSVILVCGLVTLLVILANVRLRRLNAALNRRLGEFLPKYETQFDPGRSSSGLGFDGHTHTRDET